MKTLLTLASLMLILAVANPAPAVTSEVNPPAGGPATSAPPMERDMPAAANLIEGTLLNIDGSDYFMVDATGKELRFKVDGGTKLLGEPKVGDRIKADISSEGRAASVEKVS
jgi:hypothetical protein